MGMRMLVSSAVPLVFAALGQMFIVTAGDVDMGNGYSIALVNVCERLEFLYGHPIHLKVQSELGKGTAFLFDLPRVTKGGSTS